MKEATQVQNCHVSGQAKITLKPVLKVEKVEMPQPNGVQFYLCLSGMLDPAALNRKVVSKSIQNIYTFSSSFYKRHKIGKKSLF
jgi:hypothetical protein